MIKPTIIIVALAAIYLLWPAEPRPQCKVTLTDAVSDPGLMAAIPQMVAGFRSRHPSALKDKQTEPLMKDFKVALVGALNASVLALSTKKTRETFAAWSARFEKELSLEQKKRSMAFLRDLTRATVFIYHHHNPHLAGRLQQNLQQIHQGLSEESILTPFIFCY